MNNLHASVRIVENEGEAAQKARRVRTAAVFMRIARLIQSVEMRSLYYAILVGLFLAGLL